MAVGILKLQGVLTAAASYESQCRDLVAHHDMAGTPAPGLKRDGRVGASLSHLRHKAPELPVPMAPPGLHTHVLDLPVVENQTKQPEMWI